MGDGGEWLDDKAGRRRCDVAAGRVEIAQKMNPKQDMKSSDLQDIYSSVYDLESS